MLNVFIIEQKPILRLGIKYFLEKEFKDFGLMEFDNFQESRSAAYTQNPDLIFLGVDGDFENMSGLTEVKNLYRESRLIVWDSEAKAETGIEYLRSGAQGYLSKRSDLAMLGVCVQTVMEGKIYLEPEYLEILIRGLKTSSKTFRKQIHSPNFSLSPRQHEVALLLMQGMSTSEIAIKLGLQSSTVSTVKSAIYTKLHVNSVVMLKEVMS